MTQASPSSNRSTRGTRSRHFAATRDVHRSAGSLIWLSAEIRWWTRLPPDCSDCVAGKGSVIVIRSSTRETVDKLSGDLSFLAGRRDRPHGAGARGHLVTPPSAPA